MAIEQISKSGLPSGFHIITFYYDTETKYYSAEVTNTMNTAVDISKGYWELEDCSLWAKERYNYQAEF